MKKILVVALSALMLLALFIPAMADTAPKFTVAASAAKVKQGGEFTITVSVDQKISSKGFGLQWTAVTGTGAPFEFVEGAWSSAIESAAMMAPVNPTEGAFAAMKAFDVPAGVVLTLKVKAKADAKIDVHALDFEFGTLKPENATIVDGSIEVYHDCVPATEYSKDENNHWKICTLGCDKEIGKEAHKYEGTCGDTCTVCGYVRTVTHTFTKQNSDANNHWNECTGCGKVDEASKAAHAGGTATCVEKAKCSTCGKTYGELGNHGTLNEVQDTPATCKDPAKNKKVCSICGEQVGANFPVGDPDPSKHTGGKATCKEKAKCTVCGESYGDLNPANHTGNNTVTPGVAATCIAGGKTEEVKCNDCGVVITASTTTPVNPDNHTGNNVTTPAVPASCTAEGKTEEVKCADCGKVITASKPVAKAEHKPGTDGKCEVCGETVKPTTTTRDPNVPQNGDSSNVVFFATMSIISILTLGAVVISKRAKASK